MVSSFYDPKIFELAGTAAEGVVFSAPFYDPESQDAFIKNFVDRYHERYREIPNVWSAYGYDVVRVAAQAIKDGGFDAD